MCVRQQANVEKKDENEMKMLGLCSPHRRSQKTTADAMSLDTRFGCCMHACMRIIIIF